MSVIEIRDDSGQIQPIQPGVGMNAEAWGVIQVVELVDPEDPDEEDEEEYVEEDIIQEESIIEGCWNGLITLLGQLWGTKHTDTVTDRDMEIRTTIRELMIYLLFLVNISVLTFLGINNNRYWMNFQIVQNYNNYTGAVPEQGIPGFFDYLNEQFLDSHYQENWYNNGTFGFPCPDGSMGPCLTTPADFNVMFENKVLGVPRFKQWRVHNQSCNIPPEFKNIIKVCYGPWSEENEERRDYNPGNLRSSDPKAWRYQTAKELESSMVWGDLGLYGGGGYVQDLQTSKEPSTKIVGELREYLWIDRATRLLTIDFTLYNANINYFSLVKLLFEFPPTGGIIPNVDVLTVKLLRYVSTQDYVLLGFQGVFTFMVVYYCIEELMELCKIGYRYFDDAWNYLDAVLILVSTFQIGLSIYLELSVHSKLKILIAEPDTFSDFDDLGHLAMLLDAVFAFNVFFCWLKLMKYVTFNRTMVQLQDTLARCAPDIVAFLFMFLIIFMALVQFGYLLFGPKLEYFSSLPEASTALLRGILGDLSFIDLQQAHYILGPGFFFVFIFIIVFILINMFLAIINDTYSEVKEEMEETKVQFEISDFFNRGYNNVLGTVAMRDKNIDIENAIKLANADGIVSFEELRQELKKCDFSNQEIELFFSMTDLDGDGILDARESVGAVVELNESDDEDDEHDGMIGKISDRDLTVLVTNAEFDVLEEKVQKLEYTIGSIITKIDAVLGKLDNMDSKSPVPSEEEEEGGSSSTGNGVFLLDVTAEGEVEDLIPGTGEDGNATFT